MKFEWDPLKDGDNLRKHGVPFEVAQYAFADPDRVIAEDLTHSQDEQRFFCFGIVGEGVMTVRFNSARVHNSNLRCRLLEERKEDL